jgi:hypothetical protein
MHHVAGHVRGQRIGHVDKFDGGPVRRDDAAGPDEPNRSDGQKRTGGKCCKALAKRELLHGSPIPAQKRINCKIIISHPILDKNYVKAHMTGIPDNSPVPANHASIPAKFAVPQVRQSLPGHAGYLLLPCQALESHGFPDLGPLLAK